MNFNPGAAMKFTRLAIAAAAATLALSAHAGTANLYTFDVLYHGNNVATLATGSDDPVGQAIEVDDSFDWTITAQDNYEWRVLSDGNYFPLMAFLVSPSGTRTGDWTLDLFNNGSSVFTQSEVDSEQSYIHMGTNGITLSAGLVFDTMKLNYVLTNFVPGDPPSELGKLDADFNSNVTQIQGLLPIFGAPEMNEYSPGIIYAPVPEPSTYALTLAGIAALAMVVRRRRRS